MACSPIRFAKRGKKKKGPSLLPHKKGNTTWETNWGGWGVSIYIFPSPPVQTTGGVGGSEGCFFVAVSRITH